MQETAKNRLDPGMACAERGARQTRSDAWRPAGGSRLGAEKSGSDAAGVGHGGFWSAQRELQEGGCEPGPPREWASGIIAHRMEEPALYSTTHLPVLKTDLLRKRSFCSRQLLWLLSTLNNVEVSFQ